MDGKNNPPVRTVAQAFINLMHERVDIHLGEPPEASGFTPFCDSDYSPAYHTNPRHWDFEKEFRRQVACLQFYFPTLQGKGIGFDRSYASDVSVNKITKPSNMERWILLPATWKFFGATYKEAIFSVLNVLRVAYPARGVVWSALENLSDTQILPHPATEQALRRVSSRQQHHGLLLVPVQVGRCYAGRSVVNVFQELMRTKRSEVGFGIIETALFLLYHPERLGVDYKSLWIDAPGTLIMTTSQLQAPFFRVSTNQRLEIRTSPLSEQDAQSGTATFYA